MRTRNKIGGIVTDLVFGDDRTQQGIDYAIQTIMDEIDAYNINASKEAEHKIFKSYIQGQERGKLLLLEELQHECIVDVQEGIDGNPEWYRAMKFVESKFDTKLKEIGNEHA